MTLSGALDIVSSSSYDRLVVLGGVFRVYLKFDENYSASPPEICFHTIPFHPNSNVLHVISVLILAQLLLLLLLSYPAVMRQEASASWLITAVRALSHAYSTRATCFFSALQLTW